MISDGFETLFHRHPQNPILTAADWPYPAHTVFNPGATILADGSTLLLCRVEDRRGHSHFCAARSQNGKDGWLIDATPTLVPSPEKYPEDLWGIEDARITYVEEMHHAAATADSSPGAGDRPRAAVMPDGLTQREAEILGLIARGLTNTEIAERLFLSSHTIKTHINRIFAKTGSRDRVAAIAYAQRHDIS